MVTFSHVGVCVADLDRATTFYVQALGASESHLANMNDVCKPGYQQQLMEVAGEPEVITRFVVLDSLKIELIYYRKEGNGSLHVGEPVRRPMNQLGFTHFGLRISGLEEYESIQERIRKHGGTVLSETRFVCMDYEGEPIESMYCTDPDGTRIEIMRIPETFPIGD